MNRRSIWKALALALAAALTAQAGAQQIPDIGFKSVGRGVPLSTSLPELSFPPRLANPGLPTAAEQQNILDQLQRLQNYPFVGPFNLRGPRTATPTQGALVASASNGAAPKGVQPLAIDLFTSKDFYKDRALWSDPRYFRCNSPQGLEMQRGAIFAPTIGDNPPRSAAWGFCDRDYPREAIVSPYPFRTAQAHYEALQAETRRRGGPTAHSYATVPAEWNGRFSPPGWFDHWYGLMLSVQFPTVLSLLTPEYQKRMVQEAYHQGVTNTPQWPSQYCWPEGFMRRWYPFSIQSPYSVIVTPSMVQIMGGLARNFITNIHIGRSFNMSGAVPRLGADVPRWYGETIGFWDQDTLITWTSNIQGWSAHGAFEFSSKMQTIEIYTPIRDQQGRFTGLNHESILYDPEAFVEPIRIVRNMPKLGGFEENDPYTFIECVPTIYPVKGRATPVSPGTVIEYEIPDMYGRPWAKTWEKYFEHGMERPADDDLFDFSNK